MICSVTNNEQLLFTTVTFHLKVCSHEGTEVNCANGTQFLEYSELVLFSCSNVMGLQVSHQYYNYVCEMEHSVLVVQWLSLVACKKVMQVAK